MGEQNIKFELEGEQLRVFTKALLNDLRALEYLIDNNLIESDITRIGAEQELFLVDQSFQPAPVAIELLDLLKDDHYTTELAKFNLEINLDPQVFENRCFSVLEKQTVDLFNQIRQKGREIGVHPILVGILPTIRKADLELENLTPKPRYLALNRILNSIRGQEYEFYIRGVDELCVRHDSMMVESCNASFQVHLQVKAEEFPQRYNIAQALAAPVMAVSGNSPLLFGRRLWSETRIAVFRQSVDTRASSQFLRERSTRVTFGSQWVKNSITELYKEDISRFRPLIGGELDEDAMAVVLSGDIPKLKALKLHNGTVYRWNRACYGISDGKPHLRIENRVFPSGPTVVDEVANAAFWLGLMEGMPRHFPDISQLMNFEDAKQNFYTAARLGMLSQFTWLNGRVVPSQQLILDDLLPIAREGLSSRGVASEDISRYMDIIEDRARTGKTGSSWLLRSFSHLKVGTSGSQGEQLNALTSGIISRQKEGIPVSKWELGDLAEAGDGKQNHLRVDQFMTTDLFTVQEDESIDLVANLMDWKKIRHVPVENSKNELVGLVSYRSLLHLMARGWGESDRVKLSVSDIMKRNVITIPPDTSTLEAIRLMRHNRISCLPVIKDNRLVGVVTERDFMNITHVLLEKMLLNEQR